MEFDLAKASKKLCELDLNYIYEGLNINVLWFRAMVMPGEAGAWTIERHMHSSYEFHFIKEGSCEVTTDSGSFIAEKGGFYLTPPSVFHEQRGRGNSKFIEYSLNCDLNITGECSAEMLRMVEILKESPCSLHRDDENVRCSKLFEYALKEAYFERMGYFGSIKGIIPLIVINASRKIIHGRAVPGKTEADYTAPRKSSTSNYRMSLIERFIADNISTSVSTASIASYMHLSQKQVCRIIRDSKNMSTKEYVNSIKLARARELLKNSNLHIREIADILGFSSEYYFSQFFKHGEGYSPALFRGNTRSG